MTSYRLYIQIFVTLTYSTGFPGDEVPREVPQETSSPPDGPSDHPPASEKVLNGYSFHPQLAGVIKYLDVDCQLSNKLVLCRGQDVMLKNAGTAVLKTMGARCRSGTMSCTQVRAYMCIPYISF